jgi:hypothetical protein
MESSHHDLTREGNMRGLKEHLKAHPDIDDPTRISLAETVLGRSLESPPDRSHR